MLKLSIGRLASNRRNQPLTVWGRSVFSLISTRKRRRLVQHHT